MKIIICDDQREEIEALLSLCKAYLADRALTAEVVATSEPQTLLDASFGDADLLLLDVEMGAYNGIEVKNALAARKDSPLIIFVTGHPEVMPQAFHTNVIGFLTKPVDAVLFGAYMDSAVNILTADRVFVYPDGTQGSTGDILWIQAALGYADAHCTDGIVRNLGKRSIRDLAAELEPQGFLCINSGQLVNCKYVDDLVGDTVLLRHVVTKAGAAPSDVTLTVSRRRRRDCWEKYVSYCERMQKYTV